MMPISDQLYDVKGKGNVDEQCFWGEKSWQTMYFDAKFDKNRIKTKKVNDV